MIFLSLLWKFYLCEFTNFINFHSCVHYAFFFIIFSVNYFWRTAGTQLSFCCRCVTAVLNKTLCSSIAALKDNSACPTVVFSCGICSRAKLRLCYSGWSCGLHERKWSYVIICGYFQTRVKDRIAPDWSLVCGLCWFWYKSKVPEDIRSYLWLLVAWLNWSQVLSRTCMLTGKRINNYYVFFWWF